MNGDRLEVANDPQPEFRDLCLVAILVYLPAFSILFAIELPSLGASDMPMVALGILDFLVVNALILGAKLVRLVGI